MFGKEFYVTMAVTSLLAIARFLRETFPFEVKSQQVVHFILFYGSFFREKLIGLKLASYANEGGGVVMCLMTTPSISLQQAKHYVRN